MLFCSSQSYCDKVLKKYLEELPNGEGLDDPTLTALDLGHPLVRRLLELVKQEIL